MEMDLNARSAKWKREQEKLKDRARRQAQTEALKRAAAAKAQAELEKIQQQKRQERLEEEAQREQLALVEQRLTGGIAYSQQLDPCPATNDGDKITLPVSALEALNPQGAFDLGVFTFELSVLDNGSSVNRTHAGVLEFVAEEGTVGLPPKVAASLFRGGVVPEQIQVKYVRLEKGKFARLQPRGEGFGDREIDFKAILERSLKAHTTLTEGDALFVRHGRSTFEVVVAELKPERAVNILNTDLEVALMPSESVMRKKQEEERRADAARRAEEEERERARRLMEQDKEKQRVREEKLSQLQEEPSLEERFQAKVLLRLPDGTQMTRRFAHESPLRLVFELIEASTGDEGANFQLVATYPRRLFGVDSIGKTLKELGLNGRQESLFVERIVAVSCTTEEAMPTTTVADVDVEMETVDQPVISLPVPWDEAKRVLEAQLDEALNTNVTTPIHALEPIMPVHETSDQLTKWQAQLAELAAMGFTDTALNLQILERYQGRLLRVVNYLSELGSSSSSDQPFVEPNN